MARQRRGAAPASSAGARPSAAPTRPAGYTSSHQQQRPSSTMAAPAPAPAAAPAAPPAQAAAPVQQSQGPGLFAQMASTAAGVAVGSSIGHAVGGFFSGGGSSAPAEAQQAPAAPAQPMDNGLYQSQSSWGETPACENDVRAFRKCMDENGGNMSICGWYLDQLKACQQAAKQY